jgi:integrase
MKFNKASVIAKLELPEGKTDHFVFDDDLPGFGVRIRKGGSKTYLIQYDTSGIKGRMTLGSTAKLTLEQARKLAKIEFGKIAAGENPLTARKAARQQTVVGTFKAAAEGFIAHKKEKAARGERGGRASTMESTERYLLEYAKPLHHLRLREGDLTRSQVSTLLKSINSKRGPVAADRCRSAISAALGWAIRDGLCEDDFHNPAEETNKHSEQTFKGRALSDDEIKAIWNACGDDDFGRIVKLLILTGARRNEIGKLEWTEVKDDLISLPGSRTKNHLPFDIPLTEAALDQIGQRQDRKYVFGRYASSEGFGGFSKAKAHFDAKLTGVAPWRLHDLRHTFSTKLHGDLDIEPHIVEACLNHISGHRASTAGRYNHAKYNPQKRAALEAWARRIAVITGKNVTDLGKHRKRRA